MYVVSYIYILIYIYDTIYIYICIYSCLLWLRIVFYFLTPPKKKMAQKIDGQERLIDRKTPK